MVEPRAEQPPGSPFVDAAQHLPTVDRADVIKAGRPAATLTRTPDGVEFRYLADWVERGDEPVATTLPVTDRPVLRPGGGLPAYFAGLLPEGRRLGALRRAVKTSADDELSLLLAVGTDAVGDVQVVPTGTRPDDVPPRVTVEDITDLRFADLLADLDMLGLPERAVRHLLADLVAKADLWLDDLDTVPLGEGRLRKLRRVIDYRRQRLGQ